MEETSAAQREVRSPQRSTFHKIAKKVSSLFWRSESPASKLTFRICALSKSTVATVKESLQARLEGLVNTSEIRNDEVATLSSQDEMKITALRSVDVGIEIGRSTFASLFIFCALCHIDDTVLIARHNSDNTEALPHPHQSSFMMVLAAQPPNGGQTPKLLATVMKLSLTQYTTVSHTSVCETRQLCANSNSFNEFVYTTW